jgi:hypothetical protein
MLAHFVKYRGVSASILESLVTLQVFVEQ